MQQAKRGDKVKVHYKGSLEDGTVFDSSEGRDPLEFTIGQGMVIAGFENAIVGMSEGQQKRETIPAEQAYGERQDELIFNVGRDQIPAGMEVEVGDTLQVGFGDGHSTAVQVMEMDDDSLTLDANHPLAGQTLIFEVELVAIG